MDIVDEVFLGSLDRAVEASLAAGETRIAASFWRHYTQGDRTVSVKIAGAFVEEIACDGATMEATAEPQTAENVASLVAYIMARKSS